MATQMDAITERIVKMLEQGVPIWRKSWTSMMPRNVEGRKYRGINVLLLATAGFGSPYWLTFNQCKSLGGYVKRGEKGTQVILLKPCTREDKESRRGTDLLADPHLHGLQPRPDRRDTGGPATEASLLGQRTAGTGGIHCGGLPGWPRSEERQPPGLLLPQDR